MFVVTKYNFLYDQVSIMIKITEYVIVEKCERMEMQEYVEKHILDGWQPYGHLSFRGSASNGESRYVQAMVRYEESNYNNHYRGPG